MTAEQKTRLTKVIRDAIGDCEKSIRVNDDKKARDCDQAAATFKAESEVLDTMRAHGIAHQVLYNLRLDVLNNKRGDAVDDELCKMGQEESALIDKLCALHKDAGSKFIKRRRSRIGEINNGYEAAQSALRKQIANLKRIATIANIESNVLADGMSFHEAQALWNSRASHTPSFNGMTNPFAHVVLRGGRGSFPMR